MIVVRAGLALACGHRKREYQRALYRYYANAIYSKYGGGKYRIDLLTGTHTRARPFRSTSVTLQHYLESP